MSVTGALAATVWVARPAYLHGQSITYETVTARSEVHQEIIDLIATMIGSSAEVAAIHLREQSPYLEIVMRIEGEGDTVEPEQVVLLTHSRLLQTVTLWQMTAGNRPPAAGETPADNRQPAAGASRALAKADLYKRDFPDRWRSNPAVQPVLLAAGLSDFHVQAMERGVLRITLTWDVNSADGEDEAALSVHAVLSSEF